MAVELDPGDAVMMSPAVWHSGGINRTGSIRYGVYFRWLGMPPAEIRLGMTGARRSAARSSSSR